MRAAINGLAPAIRQDLHLGHMAMGGVFLAFVGVYALLNIPADRLANRFGARRVLTATVLL